MPLSHLTTLAVIPEYYLITSLDEDVPNYLGIVSSQLVFLNLDSAKVRVRHLWLLCPFIPVTPSCALRSLCHPFWALASALVSLRLWAPVHPCMSPFSRCGFQVPAQSCLCLHVCSRSPLALPPPAGCPFTPFWLCAGFCAALSPPFSTGPNAQEPL